MTVPTDSKISVSYQATSNGQKIACLTLNKPAALNALDMDMLQSMQQHLDAWRDDPVVVAVLIDSASEKAFCAGGDIVSLYQAMQQQQQSSPEQLADFIAHFFEQEYRLDYTLHAFPKPVICWGNGIIMGGGLGIFAGASHKIVTENARVGMPEITIGLFPDVGASYFLNKMPAGVGRFMGLTAVVINAIDCLNIGLADNFIANSAKADFLTALGELENIDATSISDLTRQYQAMPDTIQTKRVLQGNLDEFAHELFALDTPQSLSEIETWLTDLANKYSHNKTLQKALKSFTNGSPITANLVVEQLKRGKARSLAECFQMELCMAYQCSISGELQEGIRALLIDKDNQPKWRFKHVNDVPQSVIEDHFNRYENGVSSDTTNPLHNLVQNYGLSRA